MIEMTEGCLRDRGIAPCDPLTAAGGIELL